ncbi:MAG: hypothetical protein WCE99_11145, partial [Nitrososphaeraceae archaeon]
NILMDFQIISYNSYGMVWIILNGRNALRNLLRMGVNRSQYTIRGSVIYLTVGILTVGISRQDFCFF